MNRTADYEDEDDDKDEMNSSQKVQGVPPARDR